MADKNRSLRREQLRRKYRDGGFTALTEQERLELLLSYSGCKTAETLAAELIAEYGSVNALADADSQLLMKDMRINEQTAVLLRLIPCTSHALYMERFVIRSINSADAAKKFFSSHFIGAVGEKLLITALSSRFRAVRTKVLAFGTAAQAAVSCREIAEFAVKSDCTVFIVAHNHPDGTSMPSESDLLFTRSVITALSKLGAVLADHIIVGSCDALSLRESGLVPEFALFPLKGYSI